MLQYRNTLLGCPHTKIPMRVESAFRQCISMIRECFLQKSSAGMKPLHSHWNALAERGFHSHRCFGVRAPLQVKVQNSKCTWVKVSVVHCRNALLGCPQTKIPMRVESAFLQCISMRRERFFAEILCWHETASLSLKCIGGTQIPLS